MSKRIKGYAKGLFSWALYAGERPASDLHASRCFRFREIQSRGAELQKRNMLRLIMILQQAARRFQKPELAAGLTSALTAVYARMLHRMGTDGPSGCWVD
jgi:hypothetical protein